MSRTLKARLTAWNLAIIAGALALFAGLLYVWLSNTLYRHHDEDLVQDAQRLADALNASERPLVLLAGMDAEDRTAPLLMVRSSDGQIQFRSSRLAATAPDVGAHTVLVHAAMRGATTTEFFTIRLARGPVRFICVPLARPAGAYLQLGRSLGDVDYLLRVVVIASAVLVPLVIVITSFGGLVVARRALKPIDHIASSLQSIQATDLSRRVDPHSRDAEVVRLTSSINRLLDRLQTSFASMREFTADVSHQLQTPLTVMKGNIDVARQAANGDGIKTGVLDELGDDVDALAATLQDLRDYALADADSASQRSEPVDVTTVFEEAADVIRALAEAHDVKCNITIERRLMVWGNAVRLRQVLLNLGENAVQFSAPSGCLRIAAIADGSQVLLTVQDGGEGIAPDALPHVFERRFHVRKPGQENGSGLGLAIVKRIVDAHGGRVDIESAVGHGTTVTVSLPAAASKQLKSIH
jgi:signal transduction histidine kinase